MPDYRRAHVPDGTYFFTINAYRRRTFLTDADVRSALREAIETLRLPIVYDRGLGVAAGHMHALWTLLSADEDFVPPLASRQGDGHAALPETQST